MSQIVECQTCGRAAIVLCGACNQPAGEPKRYNLAEVEEMILRWCGFPERTIENVRHAFEMEASGGVEGGPVPETPP